MQLIGTLALALWALVTDPTVVVRPIGAPDPTAHARTCNSYRYLLEFTVTCECPGDKLCPVDWCGLAIHSASTPCDPPKGTP